MLATQPRLYSTALRSRQNGRGHGAISFCIPFALGPPFMEHDEFFDEDSLTVERGDHAVTSNHTYGQHLTAKSIIKTYFYVFEPGKKLSAKLIAKLAFQGIGFDRSFVQRPLGLCDSV
jgi:hypothetical protein